MKIDMHVHSKLSTRSSIWLLNKIGCNESYTNPRDLYDIAIKGGMDAVTITDHNEIEGCLEILDLPNTFISCEVTAYFPEDRCKVHVLVYDITEIQFKEIDEIRENIYDLVEYLRDHEILFALAHPFYSPNDKLTVDHIEKCLLMFNHFELNGDEDNYVNQAVKTIINNMSQKKLEQISDRQGIRPYGERPWEKCLIGGSDDHSGLNISRAYTEIENAGSLQQFWKYFKDRKTNAIFKAEPEPKAMAHNIYGVAYQFYRSKFDVSQYRDRHALIRFLDLMLDSNLTPKASGLLSKLHFRITKNPRVSEKSAGPRAVDVIKHQAHKMIVNDRHFSAAIEKGIFDHNDRGNMWFRFVSQVSNTILEQLGTQAIERVSKANLFGIFESAGAAATLYAIMSPYFISYSVYAGSRRTAEKALKLIEPENAHNETKVGLFTDTLNEVNGVAHTLRNQADMAWETGKEFAVINCLENDAHKHSGKCRKYFNAINTVELPEYPDQKLFFPPVLEMMQYAFKQNYTHIHAATPGPVGLLALAISRIMKLPFYTTYHTAIPQYAHYLTDDSSIEEMTWKYILWFYDQSDIIFASSRATYDELVEKGISSKKIRLMPRGVDIKKFSPTNSYSGRVLPEGFKYIFVGRLSKEKDLPILEQAFKLLCQKRDDINLIVVGDGPYLEQMRENMAGTPTLFTGYLQGQELRTIYNACDIFVFPSTTDTFGNVVLEAQAAGLPVIVSDAGGPQENIIKNNTGIITEGLNVQSFYEAMLSFVENHEMRLQYSKSARKYAESRSLQNSFEQFWSCYGDEQFAQNKSNELLDQLASAGISGLTA